MIQFNWYPFADLTIKQLYDSLQLRSEIFVVEQSCVYLDIDGRDQYAIHLLGYEQDALVAYIRLFPPTDIENYVVFGRVVTSKSTRGLGYGRKLVAEMFQYCEKHYAGITIQCSAQLYLKKFYESFGLVAQGEVYEEDGIPHIHMVKEPNK